jgi:hypothetical protein
MRNVDVIRRAGPDERLCLGNSKTRASPGHDPGSKAMTVTIRAMTRPGPSFIDYNPIYERDRHWTS